MMKGDEGVIDNNKRVANMIENNIMAHKKEHKKVYLVENNIKPSLHTSTISRDYSILFTKCKERT